MVHSPIASYGSAEATQLRRRLADEVTQNFSLCTPLASGCSRVPTACHSILREEQEEEEQEEKEQEEVEEDEEEAEEEELAIRKSSSSKQTVPDDEPRGKRKRLMLKSAAATKPARQNEDEVKPAVEEADERDSSSRYDYAAARKVNSGPMPSKRLPP